MWCLKVTEVIAIAIARAEVRGPSAAPELDRPMLFGFLWTLLTLLFFAYRRQAPRFVLGFAICLAGLGIYGATQAMWSLATIAALWSAATLGQWRSGAPDKRLNATIADRPETRTMTLRCDESRMSRMFGPS